MWILCDHSQNIFHQYPVDDADTFYTYDIGEATIFKNLLDIVEMFDTYKNARCHSELIRVFTKCIKLQQVIK